jgi:hypothetical protein
MSSELVNISIGELWDKYSILLIKKDKINNTEKKKYINLEIKYLNTNMNKYEFKTNSLFINLKKINEKLWDIEDKLRIKELNKEFDEDFINLARNVYFTNDERAICKKDINNLFGSNIHEIKDYVIYK